MFFLSISKGRNTDGDRLAAAQEFTIDAMVFRVVTDNFLSRLIFTTKGFSVIESPHISASEAEEPIFSRIIYDKTNGRLSIERSTVSGRPIYYWLNREGELACSTHIRMFRQAGIKIEENSRLLPGFFIYRFMTPPQTIYKDIQQVITGERVEMEFGGGNWQVRRRGEFIPSLPRAKDDSLDVEKIAAKTLHLLTRSCGGLKTSGNQILVLLSGGLDSSILFRTCQSLFEVGTTFSTGYPFEDASGNREREYAISAARAFGTHHEYYEPSGKDYLHGLLQAISAAEEPVQHLQSVLLLLLFKQGLPKGRGIVVSGQGADAIFGPDLCDLVSNAGRMWFKLWVSLFSRHPYVNLVKRAAALTGRGRGVVHNLYWNSVSRAPLKDIDHPAWQLDRYGDVNWVCGYFNTSIKEIVTDRSNALTSLHGRSLFDTLSIVSLFGSIAATQGIWSKLGESAKKILVYPYTDTELMRYAYGVPWDIKLAEPKHVLRSAGRLLSVPDHIVNRPKSSFGIHQRHWASRGDVFEPLIPLAAKVFDEKQIRMLQCAEHSKAMTFWNILNYALWKRLCIDNEPLSLLEEELTESISGLRRASSGHSMTSPYMAPRGKEG